MVKSLLEWKADLEEAESENPRKGLFLREEGEGDAETKTAPCAAIVIAIVALSLQFLE